MADDKAQGNNQDEVAGPEDAGTEGPEHMSEEELREALEQQFRETKVSDMLVQYMASLSHIAYIKMGLTDDTKEVRDLPQASLAIDGFKSLLDAVKDRIDAQDASALEGALASMQMTFAQQGAAAGGTDESGSGDASAGEDASASSDAAASDEKKPEGDDPSSRLWVPGKE
jgi:hypothetical protein